MQDAYTEFITKYPEYKTTSCIDELRLSDYSRIDRTGQIYLDYTGGGLYADSQVIQHQSLLLSGVFGNPHSTNPTSLAATELIESACAYVLRFFNASTDEYDVDLHPQCQRRAQAGR
jgi:molybdenum cofactor sulfurtransferase